ncbi:LOW QUALITY PROTEIN: glial cell line-derived neurotrophic factor [Takifugu flavidus]|uniref:LOW QUALITY PROTEIN: glial cell line-derived neurotrophic factor n=1 Tax=Takifugu flavidus TaxID=433684 RepID=UPI0025441A5B|nr:LOW QUALITY PROTEIN: glial cell line-derived neurotrophic factor [Takifugu flavidus]
MKLWDSLTTCLILLSAVRASVSRQHPAMRRRSEAESPPELPQSQTRLVRSGISRTDWGEELGARRGKGAMEEASLNEYEDVVNFIKVTISRIQHSSSSSLLLLLLPSSSSSTAPSPTKDSGGDRQGLSGRARQRRQKTGVGRLGDRGARRGETGKKVRGGPGRGQGCALKQIHLNVTDLGLGYRSSEEMIFRYCSGPCRKSQTNYDKILYNLANNRKLPPKDTPSQACCRPTAFDDDLSFLDDNLVYHTVRKHSARKCGCV